MTQDEVIELAVKAGMRREIVTMYENPELLEAFAKLVAQREREKFIDMLRMAHDSLVLASDPGQLKERGTR